MDEAKTKVVLAKLRAGRLRDAYVDPVRRGWTALMDAVEARHEPAVVRLIASDRNVDAIAEGPESALSLACKAGAEHLVGRLLVAGADPAMRLRDGYTLMHLAAARAPLGVLRALVGAGARVEATRGGSALAVAIANDRLDVLDYLIELPLPYSEPAAAFHVASELGHVAALQRLHDRFGDAVWEGSSPNPLMRAAAGGHTEAVRWLIERGAEIDVFDLKDERSPLMHAAAGGHLEAARVLLEHGASASAMTEWFVTPLRIAEARGDAAMCDLLRAHGATSGERTDIHVTMPYATYSSAVPGPRRIASIAEALATDDVVALSRLDVAVPVIELGRAAQAGALHCVAYLLAIGADPHDQRPSALVYAIRAGDAKIVRMMLAAAPTTLDREITDWAVGQSDPWVLDAVLKAGAPATTRALEDAAGSGRWPHVAVLLARGAVIDEDSNGSSPLSSAASGGHVRCVNLLVDHELATGGLQTIRTPGMYKPHLAGIRRIDMALLVATDPRMIELLIQRGADAASVARLRSP